MSRGGVRQVSWKYEGQIRKAWGYTVVLDGKRIRRAGYTSKADAAQALEAIRHPEPAPPAVVETMTLQAAFTRYFDVKSRKKSLAEDRRNAKHLLAEFGETTPLTEITASRISRYQERLLAIKKSRRGGPLSAASINRPLSLLRCLLGLASRKWEVLKTVPVIEHEKEPQGKIRWLEPDEEARLLAACGRSTNPFLLGIVTVALETGMRQKELFELEWNRVDFSRGILRIEESKSDRRRDVPMRQPVYSILASMPSGSREGRVWPFKFPRKPWETAVKNAKLDSPLTFHGCRHHFASWWMMRGGSLLGLQKVGGWATLAMVMRYAHLSPQHLRDEMVKTERTPEISGRTQAEEIAKVEESV